MLVLTRRPGESLLLSLDPRADPSMTLGELFARGPIEITCLDTGPGQARIGIDAPRAIAVMRNGLVRRVELFEQRGIR